jgi:hypothetical protein
LRFVDACLALGVDLCGFRVVVSDPPSRFAIFLAPH